MPYKLIPKQVLEAAAIKVAFTSKVAVLKNAQESHDSLLTLHQQNNLKMSQLHLSFLWPPPKPRKWWISFACQAPQVEKDIGTHNSTFKGRPRSIILAASTHGTILPFIVESILPDDILKSVEVLPWVTKKMEKDENLSMYNSFCLWWTEKF